MQEQTIFVAEDGTRFDNKEDCLEWDEISERVKILEEAEQHMWDKWIPSKGLKEQKSGFILFAAIAIMIIS